MLPCTPAAVIGPGRVGRAISNMASPTPAPLYGRSAQLPKHLKGPLWVCTTNDALDNVLQRVQPSQWKQLIFIQNGMLLPWLTLHGLQHNTQVLLYMSAAEDGSVTDGGRTAVCGPLASHVVQLLQQGGVHCIAVDSWEAYNSAMAVKLLWSSVFWLLSSGLGGVPVGHIVEQHTPAVEALVAELLPIAWDYLARTTAEAQQQQQQQQQEQEQDGLSLPTPTAAAAIASNQHQHIAADPQAAHNSSRSSTLQGLLDHSAVMEQLLGYSRAIAAAVPSTEMARREFAWRNGWFLSERVTPLHAQWLAAAGCQDLLGQHAAAGGGGLPVRTSD